LLLHIYRTPSIGVLFRYYKEDSITERICVCPTLEGAVSAFPYKGEFVNVLMRRRKDNYLAIYTTETNRFLDWNEISDKVPDSYLTKECWILEPFKSKPQIIKVKKLTLSKYNKHVNLYGGQVKEFEYEADTVEYDRCKEFILLSKRMLNKFSKIANEYNFKIEVMENKHIHLEHIYGVRSTKKYRWIKVNAFIPSGVSIAPLWLLDNEQNNFAIRKKIIFKEGVYTNKNIKDYYCYNDFDKELIENAV